MFFIGKSFLQGALLGITNILGMTEFDYYINNSEEDVGNTTSLFFTIYTLLLLYYSNSRTSNFELLVLVVFVVLFNIFQMMGHQSGRVAYPFCIIMWLQFHTYYRIYKAKIRYYC